MRQRRVRVKLVGPRASGSRDAKRVFWDQLMGLERQPFIPGAVRAMSPRAYSLSYRRGEKVETWYVPRTLLKEVREMTDRYRMARELLAKIANIELAQLKARAAETKKSATERARKRKRTS